MLDRHSFNALFSETNPHNHDRNAFQMLSARMIRPASINNAEIHVPRDMYVLKMLNAMYKHIDHCVFAGKVLPEMRNILVMRVSTIKILYIFQRKLI